MKTLIGASALATVLALGACAQQNTDPNQPGYRNGVPICLPANQIERTEVPDASTILFYMKDKSVWQNTLPTPCPELKFNGFSFSTGNPEYNICSNQETVHVLRTLSTCPLGPFTPYTPPAKPQ
jgi:hypothetical protein